PALDALPGFTVEGDVAAVTRWWLDGTTPTIAVETGLEDWPTPARPDLRDRAVLVTDRDEPPLPQQVLLHPPSLVVGVGASSGADPDGLDDLVRGALRAAGLHPDAVGVVATI